MDDPNSVYIAVLVPEGASAPPPPEATPLGRAALSLASAGVHLLFGARPRSARLCGLRATASGWVAEEHDVDAAYDRLPAVAAPALREAALAGLVGLPVGNPPALIDLCRDKLRCQGALDAAGVGGLPPVEGDPARFAARIAEWGVAFHKPRFGSQGVGVRRWTAADGPPPPSAPGLLDAQLDPAILQFAVPPPAGWAGWSLRVLCQRLPDGGWTLAPTVLRRSLTDPVVNAARGAALAPAEDHLQQADHNFARGLALTVAGVLGRDEAAVELGVDLVVDRDGHPWIVEVNGRPDGRLAGLAKQQPVRYGPAAEQAARRPFERLAAVVRARRAGLSAGSSTPAQTGR